MKKVILGILIGLSLSTISVVAISLCNAKDIKFSADDTTWDVDTVEDALNDLYNISDIGLSNQLIEELQKPFIFTYTGNYQKFIVPVSGLYQIELWGAGGGKSLYQGELIGDNPKGAYTSGTIFLDSRTILYLYVGGKGTDAVLNKSVSGGYNGGGAGDWDHNDDEASGGGGGATDVRLVEGDWNNFDSLKSRIMVAGGAGGASYLHEFGNGGGVYAKDLSQSALGGHQIKGYAFGYGQDGNGHGYILPSGDVGVAGGGGGYFGGLSSDSMNEVSAAGGSSFISGHSGCSAITKDSTIDNMVHSMSIHYSGYYFTNTRIVDGDGYEWTNIRGAQTGMPTFDGLTTMNGNAGDGYIKITYLGNKKNSEACDSQQIIDLEYTGKEIEFNTYCQGNYKIELWGASGGRSLVQGVISDNYAKGAYTAGNIHLNSLSKLYFYVGGKGSDGALKKSVSGGYNGGGTGDWDHGDDEASGGGGGATDVRLTNGIWNNFDSLKSRIMVAAGGGGNSYNLDSSSGGGLYASTLFETVLGGSQTSGYAFGYGQNGIDNGNTGSLGVGGGGGGYYGGEAKAEYYKSSGTGGSSFISGHNGCDAILEESTQKDIKHSGQPNHYSKYVFTNTKMIDGDGYEWVDLDRGNKVQMPNTDGTDVMDGNTGNGYAKITYLGK